MEPDQVIVLGIGNAHLEFFLVLWNTKTNNVIRQLDLLFELLSKQKTIAFVASDQVSWSADSDTLTIRLTATAAQAIAAALKPVAGKINIPAANGLLIDVQRTNILGRDGEVVSVVG